MRAWVNGRLLQSPDELSISALDHGMIVGDGVFETVQISNDRPFALTRHLDRLVRSATGLGIGTPDVGAIREGIAATMDGQQISFGRIRVTVTSGPGPLGSPRGSGAMTHTVVSEPSKRPPSVAQVVTVPWPRNERGALSGLKTTSYAENALMIEHATARGASEAILPNTRGQLCEGTGSNIMYVVDGRLITPTLEAGPLAGVTRALVLEWCAGEIDVVEQDAPIEVLQTADEVILVGTTRDVQAISRVDDREIEAPGPVTQLAQQIWAREAARGIDP
ncbi:aminotransferase class IV [Aeromicrobium fastidiosum]|uniref:4-amino-4-deoxychorismate lyase n=1 Tax=Aeromicrobium fastidiosum TaxID=52699 RepID=A0A641AJT6_9ACTN|nr:aminotransferase class IV [Aeromicrobium fastidiosum]KAA1376111.1 4-amino-4-deoxychorismate lyase [Aeromicrobium fastidiosum]MBP2392009.1 branched-chain amino acid aminotransferase [Aeromicrobium fastidiosum]